MPSRNFGMLRKLTAALMMLALLCAALAAPASAGVSAQPIDRLTFRTGPNTRYTELFTLPESTEITALAYAEGNGVTWVQVEFIYDDAYFRAYTGLKRMRVNGSIPWESFMNWSEFPFAPCTVYSAPCTGAAIYGRLASRELVTYLSTDGDYDYIEYYDAEQGAPCRGYIETDNLAMTDGMGAYLRESATVYEGSSGSSSKGSLPEGMVVGYLNDYGSRTHILYYNTRIGDLDDGYVSSSAVAQN